MCNDCFVEAVAAETNRFGINNAIERDNRDLSGTTADIYDHRPARLLDRQPSANRRRHRLLDQADVSSTRASDRFTNRATLNLSRFTRHANQHAGTRWEKAVFMHFVDKMLQHLLSDLKIGDHAIFQRADCHDISGCSP